MKYKINKYRYTSTPKTQHPTPKTQIMKKIILLLMLLGMGSVVQAQEKLNKNAKYEFQVSGNCGMCKKRIEKAALSVSGVKMANWNQENGQLKLILDEEKALIDSVHAKIAKAGHDTEKVKAKEEDYKSLHECCQYTRK